MIDVKVKIHDKFSLEFKISSIVPTGQSHKSHKDGNNEFSINTWLFVPNSLDINRTTYSKERFYRDTKSNIRLITPVYSLKEIYNGKDSPVSKLERAIHNLLSNPDDKMFVEDYTFQVKMFSTIFKSAVRDRAYYIIEEPEQARQEALLDEYIADVRIILTRYRDFQVQVNSSEISEDSYQVYVFGDDFIGNILEQNFFRIMRRLKNSSVYDTVEPKLYKLLEEESQYKSSQGYSQLNKENETDNYLVIMRRGILKKFIESDLYLNTKRLKDGAFAEQFYYGIAAGISMIFATVIAFTAQMRYGNFTLPLFFALVVSYIFKDRIKDLMRYYLSTQLGKKYFDNKRKLEIQEHDIGWVKESFDYVTEDKTPDSVMGMRKRTPLVEAENKIYNEKILLYKKLVQLVPSEISLYKGYRFRGINDITRFNFTHFVQKMDNPFIPIYMPDKKNGYISYNSEKVYAIYIIIRCEGDKDLYYRKFRMLLNREGIKEVKEIEVIKKSE